MIKNSVRAKLVIPIPYQVLLSPAQRQILNAFTRLHESHRFLYFRPEIVEIPHSASATEILTARDLLAPIGRGVGVLTDLFDPNRAVLAADKIMLGCEFRTQSEKSLDQIETALTGFQRMAGKRATYALGLSEHSTIAKAAELGFSEIGGPGLRTPLKKRPEATEPYPLSDLLRH